GWLGGSVERRRALEAAGGQIGTLRAREQALAGGLVRVRERAARLKETLSSGETALLPPSAVEPKALITPEAVGQRFVSLHITKQLAGPSRLRRSRFFRRK